MGFLGLVLWIGMMQQQPLVTESTLTWTGTATITQTSQIIASMDAHNVVTEVKLDSSLWNAGLRKGDQVESVTCNYVVRFRKHGRTHVVIVKELNECR